MKTLKDNYNNLIEQRNKVIERIQELENSKIIKEYKELKKQNDCLYHEQLKTYKNIKEKEYDSCEHILVYSEIEQDVYDGRTHKSCGCIKCGLDNSVLNYDRNWISYDKQVMYNYLQNNYLNGKHTKINCNIGLAQAIYSKIKGIYPNIDDETVIKYFEIELNNIKNIDNNYKRKDNREKKLQLKWDSIHK